MYTKPEEATPEESKRELDDAPGWAELMGELDRMFKSDPMEMEEYRDKAIIVAERLDACKELAKYVLGPDVVLDLNVLERFYRIMEDFR